MTRNLHPIERRTPLWLPLVLIPCALVWLGWTVAEHQAAFLARAESEVLP
ncbi:MAG: hypothetical protein AB7O44_32320 [Hyphomicrobiaceae bacterium]